MTKASLSPVAEVPFSACAWRAGKAPPCEHVGVSSQRDPQRSAGVQHKGVVDLGWPELDQGQARMHN